MIKIRLKHRLLTSSWNLPILTLKKDMFILSKHPGNMQSKFEYRITELHSYSLHPSYRSFRSKFVPCWWFNVLLITEHPNTCQAQRAQSHVEPPNITLYIYRYVSFSRTGREYDKVSGVAWIPVKRRTIQSRSRILSPENGPVYRVFCHNGVQYRETYLYIFSCADVL